MALDPAPPSPLGSDTAQRSSVNGLDVQASSSSSADPAKTQANSATAEAETFMLLDGSNGSGEQSYFVNGRQVDLPARDTDAAKTQANSDTAEEELAIRLEGLLGRNQKEEHRRLVLFDGICRLCMGFVDLVISCDGSDRFRFAPLQSDLGQQVLKQYGYPHDLDSVVLVRNGESHIKSEAALEIIGELHGLVSGLWAFKALPTGFRDWGYELVAKSRYSLLGHSSLNDLDDSHRSLLLDHWVPDPNQPQHVCSS